MRENLIFLGVPEDNIQQNSQQNTNDTNIEHIEDTQPKSTCEETLKSF